jgi:hypothetical protein
MSIRPQRPLARRQPTAGARHLDRALSSSPSIRFRVDFDDHSSVGDGKIRLLDGTSGSLPQAARDIGMSYRRAWLLIDR